MNLNHIFMQDWCYVIELTINTERREVRKLWNWTYATSRCSLLPRLVFHRRSMLVCAHEDSNKDFHVTLKYRKKQNQIIVLQINIIVYWERKYFKLIILINRVTWFFVMYFRISPWLYLFNIQHSMHRIEKVWWLNHNDGRNWVGCKDISIYVLFLLKFRNCILLHVWISSAF